MNADLYRHVFDPRRGMRVAVAECQGAVCGGGAGGRRRKGLRAGLGVFLLTVTAAAAAQVLPGGATVVRGAGSVQVDGAAMTVRQDTARMVTDWRSFSIGADASVRFVQPSAQAVALNRVNGGDPSAIFGSLSANGHVYLQNPNGVLFAPGAQVDVGSLVATTLNADLTAFMAGRLDLAAGAGTPGAVVNEGELRAGPGGYVLLAGPQVTNRGRIEAPGGTIGLAAGRAVTVDATGAGLLDIQVPVAAIDAQLTHSGQSLADGGRISLQVAAADAARRTVMQVDGLVQARKIENRGGQIVLSGGGSGVVQVGGTLEATADASRGGDVTVLGEHVALLDGARIDASGSAGGGTVLVGGNVQGQGPLPNAQAVFMAPQAAISADATDMGQGGQIVLWSDHATRVYGALSARGGTAGGDGGFIETSGGWLDARPASVRTDAPAGRAGMWLLDPNDILIEDGDVLSNASGGPDFTTTDDAAVIGTLFIVNALESGNNVTITTGAAGSDTEAGDITMLNATINPAPSVPVSLTLTAHRNIDITGSQIFSNAGVLNINMFAGEAGNGGAIRIVDSSLSAGSFFGEGSLSGGSIVLGGRTAPSFGGFAAPFAGAVGFDAASGARGSGIQITNSSLYAGRDSGSIQLRGTSIAQSPPPGEDIQGVFIDGSSYLSAANIDVRGWVSSNPDISRYGVYVGGDVDASLKLDLVGEARSSAYYPNDGSGTSVIYGTHVDSDATLYVGDPSCAGECSLTLDGISESGAGASGAFIHSSGLVIDGSVYVSHGATANFTGIAYGGAVETEWGVLFEPNSVLDLSGAGLVTFDTRTAADLAQTSNSIGYRGVVTLPLDDYADVYSDEDVYFEGEVNGAPLELYVNAIGEIRARGNAGGPPLPQINLTGSASLVFDAPGVYIGSTSPGNSYSISAGGPITIYADYLRFRASGSLASGAEGDAVVFAGYSVANVEDFAFEGSGPELSTPAGRWLVYAIDPTTTFDSGNLAHDFRQYVASFGSATPAESGNGLLFSIAPVLTAGLGSGVSISKTYDALLSVPGPAPTLELSGFIGGDNSSGAPANFTSLAFADKNVGTGKTVNVAGLSLPAVFDGSDRPVYGYGVRADVVGDITARPVTVTGVTAADKVYDATTVAALTGTPTVAALGGDVVTVSGTPTASFSDKSVGTGKPVSVLGYTLLGVDAGNYQLLQPSALSADISAALLALSGVTALDKVYDAGTAATLSGTPTISPFGTDVVNLDGTLSGSFADKSVGTAKPVSLAGVSIGGTDAGNYTLLLSNALSADILALQLAVSGVTADNKQYDATTAATLSGTAAVSPLGSDVVTVGGTPAANFSDKNVGTAKPVSVAGYSLGGTDAGNYSVAQPSGLSADITARPVTVTGVTAADKVYDATTVAALTGTPTVAALGGDVVTVSGTPTASFSDKNVGTAKPVTVSGGYTLTGADAGNYLLMPTSAITGLSADITVAELMLLGLTAQDRVYDKTTDVALSGLPTVLPLGDDNVAVVGSPVASFADPNAGAAKPVLVSGLSLTGQDATNYTLVVPATLTATNAPRTLTPLGITAVDRLTDGTTEVVLDTSQVSIVGVLPGDSVLLDASGAIGAVDSPNPGANKQVTLLGLTLTGPDAGNYAVDTLPPIGAGGVTVTLIPALLPVFEALRYKEYLQAVSDAQEPFRRAMAEALAAGFGKENIRKRLAAGLVFETGLAAPAIDQIQPAGGPPSCDAGGAMSCR